MCILQSVLACAHMRVCVCVCVCVHACACTSTHIILRKCLSHSLLEKLVMELDIQNCEVVHCRNGNLKDINFAVTCTGWNQIHFFPHSFRQRKSIPI